MNITELRALSIENAKKLMTQDIGAGQAFSNLFFAIDVFYNQEAGELFNKRRVRVMEIEEKIEQMREDTARASISAKSARFEWGAR